MQTKSTPPPDHTPPANHPPIIGLTGGIGSGKTAVSDWFADQGIDVVDADVIAHDLMRQGSDALQAVAATFGDWVIDDTGNYDRVVMRQYVFDHPDARAKLNAILHPRIQHAILDAIQDISSPYGILSVPLLLENRHQSPLYGMCQRILVVDVPVTLQLLRASKRDGSHPAQIHKMIDAQIGRAERLSLADDVVDNSADLASLHAKLQHLHEQYLRLANHQAD